MSGESCSEPTPRSASWQAASASWATTTLRSVPLPLISPRNPLSVPRSDTWPWAIAAPARRTRVPHAAVACPSTAPMPSRVDCPMPSSREKKMSRGKKNTASQAQKPRSLHGRARGHLSAAWAASADGLNSDVRGTLFRRHGCRHKARHTGTRRRLPARGSAYQPKAKARHPSRPSRRLEALGNKLSDSLECKKMHLRAAHRPPPPPPRVISCRRRPGASGLQTPIDPSVPGTVGIWGGALPTSAGKPSLVARGLPREGLGFGSVE